MMLDKALRRAKRKQKMTMVGIAILVVLIFLPSSYYLMNKMAS